MPRLKPFQGTCFSRYSETIDLIRLRSSVYSLARGESKKHALLTVPSAPEAERTPHKAKSTLSRPR